LGADVFVSIADKDFAEKYFDKICYLSCAEVEHLPLGDMLSRLKFDGAHFGGLPDWEWNGLKPMMMASKASCIGSSHIESKNVYFSSFSLVSEPMYLG
jgi:hypothetical protein